MYEEKYLKYKSKYLELKKNMMGGMKGAHPNKKPN
jgi:hypothetical protein